MKKALKSQRFLIPFIILSLITILFIQNCTKETIVIYKPFTEEVTLIYPINSAVFDSVPPLIWESLSEAVNYQVQLASDPAFSNLIFTKTKNDTTYTYNRNLDSDQYYWRVRAENSDEIWGDWSNAIISSFYISDSLDVVRLLLPINSVTLSTTPELIWSNCENTDSFKVQISEDAGFASFIVDTAISDTTYRYEYQLDNGTYFWRISAQIDDSSWGAWSEAIIWFFRINNGLDEVQLIYPPNTGLTFTNPPELIWSHLNGAVVYQVMIATNSSFTNIEATDTIAGDTVYACGDLGNDMYYWRVRARDNLNVWGDWSNAMVWSFRINDNANYIALLAVMATPGTAQDVFVDVLPDSGGADMDVAFVADGHALLTMFDVSNPADPVYITNIDRDDGDFAQSVWKLPDDHFVYIADTDGKVMALNLSYPLNPDAAGSGSITWEQNTEDLTGFNYSYPDTIYLFSINSGFTKRYIQFTQIVYEDGLPRRGDLYNITEIQFPSDPEGVYFDTMSVYVEYCDTTNDVYTVDHQSGMFIFIAASQAGLWWINISATHTADGTDSLLLNDPRVIGWVDTPSIALAVQVQNGFAYVADDRGGLQIFDLPDTIPSFDHDSLYSANPVLASSFNTSGRTKDVHVVGNRCYLADGSGGLKVVDISNPYAPTFLAAYSTPYAYGVWADEENTYIADRDNGLMIFENR